MPLTPKIRRRVTRNRLARKSDARTVQKQCSKCGQRSWCRPRERACKQQNYGPRSYACWGALVPVKAAEADATASSDIAVDLAILKTQRGQRWRIAAAKKADAAGAMAERYRARERRSVKLAEKWERRLASQKKRAAMTDDDVQAVYDRAQHAQHVQKVRRRLVGKPKPIRFMRGVEWLTTRGG